MKISKLFHWLYAILMLLPILVFIPTAFYYGFNHEAVAQEKTEQVPVYYESNKPLTNDDLIINNVYYFGDSFSYLNNTGSSMSLIGIKLFTNVGIDTNIDISQPVNLFINNNTSNLFCSYTRLSDNTIGYNELSNRRFSFILLTKYTYSSIIVPYLDEVSILKEYQPLVTNMSITDSMSYAWDSTWQNYLFSWSYDSFLTQPFLYITNLFNVPVNNTLVYCLSYWLNISIIWLVFDVIMYVPLLVHRWLDKGIVE